MKAITTALTLIITLAALNSHAVCMKKFMASLQRDNAKTAFVPATMTANESSSSQAVSRKR